MISTQDFAAFVELMRVNTTLVLPPLNGLIDVPLLESGSTTGASNRLPSISSLLGLGRKDRESLGYQFEFPEPFRLLLSAWRDVRPTLHSVLRQSELCLGCGGTVANVNGTAQFTPLEDYRYDNDDVTASRLMEAAGEDQIRRLRALLLECCMCFFSTYVDPAQLRVSAEEWKGPVPPIRELIEVAGSAYALTTRKVAGLTAIEPSVLASLCDVSRGSGSYSVPSEVRNKDGVREEMCQEMLIPIGAGGNQIEVNSCELGWEPRLLEATIAQCVQGQLLNGPSADMEEKSSDRRSKEFTLATTQEWWNEYTRVPPMQRVDDSRRKVVGYYTMSDCSQCGACGHVRVDTRQFVGVSTSNPLPTGIAASEVMHMRVSPANEDWRLDQFEARQVPMVMRVQIRIKTGGGDPASLLSKVDVCIVPGELEPDLQGLAPDGWNVDCIAIREAVSGSVASTSRAQAGGVEGGGAWRAVEEDQTAYQKEIEAVLPASADGWVVAIANRGSQSVSVRLHAQLALAQGVCSDKSDGAAQVTEPTHSTRLNDAEKGHVSTRPGKCLEQGRTYCDGSVDSGRQLDLCGVCGGACFPPLCAPLQCPETNPSLAARVRFTSTFASSSGVVSKQFSGVPSCDSAGSLVACEPYGCDFLGDCSGRRETYRVDTRFLVWDAGVPFVFQKGAVLIEPAAQTDERVWSLIVSACANPDHVLRAGGAGGWEMAEGVGEGGGGVLGLREDLSQRAAVDGNGTVPVVTAVQTQAPHQIVLQGTAIVLMQAVAGMTFTPDSDAGTTLEDRQSLLRFDLRLLSNTGQVIQGGNGGQTVGCNSDGFCRCVDPGVFAGPGCDFIKNRLDITVTVRPQQRGQRIVPPPPTPSCRRPTVSRGGHGTHTASTVAGEAFDPAIPDTLVPGLSHYNGIASGAKLWFLDIGHSGSSYLSPPEAKGDAMMGLAYREGNARVFLCPWSCYDYAWWDPRQNPYTAEGRLAEEQTPLGSTLCNRYTTDAWEMDHFVWDHPDMLLVVPAGDNGRSGPNSIASPGTCKNCLVVGASESWPSDLVQNARFLLSQCRPGDCPQKLDPTAPCGSSSVTSHLETPACCSSKYATSGPDRVSVDSGRGFAVSKQARGAGLYVDTASARFGRIKPDVVAPGVNVVSARSDGNTGLDSGGTNGCRCCAENGGRDQAAVAAMSGTSMAAASVAGLAALVREWFDAGFYPTGVRAGSNAHAASAAMVRAVIVSAGESMARSAGADGRVEDIASLPTPNLHAGFGRPRLLSVLRIVNDTEDNAADDIRIFAKDHTVVKERGPGSYVRIEDVAERVTARGFSIVQDEEMVYELVVRSATQARPLVVSLAWTDPPSSLGSADILVNNLDVVVTVTPLLEAYQDGMTLGEALELSRDSGATQEYWGNEVQGGDAENNVEKIVVRDAPAAAVVVRVIARHVSNAYPCQPFALVVSGRLAGATLDIVPWRTDNFRPGVCGREPEALIDKGGVGIPWVTIAVSVASVVFGFAFFAAIYHKWIMRKEEKRTAALGRVNAAGTGYMPQVKDTANITGAIRKSGHGWVNIEEERSNVDSFYLGMHIEVPGGLIEGPQKAVITGYDGKSRTVFAGLLVPPKPGDPYKIYGGGYQVGGIGYVELAWDGEQPDGGHEGQFSAPGKLRSKHKHGIEHSRRMWGTKTDVQLEQEGIGKTYPARTKEQVTAALSANVHVGQEVSSGDIYLSALKRMNKEAPPSVHGPQLHAYASLVHARSETTPGRKTAKEIQLQDDGLFPPAPPLRIQRAFNVNGRSFSHRHRSMATGDTLESLASIKASLQKLSSTAALQEQEDKYEQLHPELTFPNATPKPPVPARRNSLLPNRIQFKHAAGRHVTVDRSGYVTDGGRRASEEMAFNGAVLATASLGFTPPPTGAAATQAEDTGEAARGVAVYRHAYPFEPGQSEPKAAPPTSTKPAKEGVVQREKVRSFLQGLESSKKLLMVNTMTAQQQSGSRQRLLDDAFGTSPKKLPKP